MLNTWQRVCVALCYDELLLSHGVRNWWHGLIFFSFFWRHCYYYHTISIFTEGGGNVTGGICLSVCEHHYANLHKWGLAQLASCDCGHWQTMNHIVNTCPLTKFEGGLKLLHKANDTQSYGCNQQRSQQLQNENYANNSQAIFVNPCAITTYCSGKNILNFGIDLFPKWPNASHFLILVAMYWIGTIWCVPHIVAPPGKSLLNKSIIYIGICQMVLVCCPYIGSVKLCGLLTFSSLSNAMHDIGQIENHLNVCLSVCLSVCLHVCVSVWNTYHPRYQLQWKIAKIDEKQRRTAKHSTMWEIDVAESISSDRFTTRSRINALSAHAQTLLSCLRQITLDRLWVRLNACCACVGDSDTLLLLTMIYCFFSYSTFSPKFVFAPPPRGNKRDWIELKLQHNV